MKFSSLIIRRKMQVILIGVIMLFGVSSYATTYYTTGDGNWTNPVWSPSVPPTTIGVGDSAIIYHDIIGSSNMTINGTLIIQNGHSLTVSSNKISVSASGKIINEGTFVVKQLINSGIFENNGASEITGTTVAFPMDNSNGNLTNNGTLDVYDKAKNNNGTITNNGMITTGEDMLNNNGSLTNNMSIYINEDLDNTAGLVTNNGNVAINQNLDNTNGNLEGQNGDYDIDGTLNNSNGNIDGNVFIDVCSSNGFTYNMVGNGYINWSTVTFCGMILPVELIYFDVELKNNQYVVSWAVASEMNTRSFTVEKSLDGVVFEEIGTLQGQGNSMSLIEYTCTDDTPATGVSYYRLKQTDNDDNYGYFPLVAVDYENGIIPKLDIYPNPSNGEVINLSISGSEDDEVELVIFNPAGEAIYSEQLVNDNGSMITSIYPNNKLAAGIYMVVVKGDTHKFEKKLIIH